MMMRRFPIKATVLIAALLAAGNAGAVKLYKWVDEDGNVTYSQQRPPSAAAQTLDLKGYQSPDPVAREKLEKALEADKAKQKDREFAAGEAAAKHERDARIKKNCEIARQNMRVLRNSSRIRNKNKEGKPYFLDAKQVEAKITETQRHIDDYCN